MYRGNNENKSFKENYFDRSKNNNKNPKYQKQLKGISWKMVKTRPFTP